MGVDIDVIIDCVGFIKSMKIVLKVIWVGGCVCFVGMGYNEMIFFFIFVVVWLVF